MNFQHSKILIVTSEFPPLPGGIGNHAFNLSKQLCLHGFLVTVLTNKRTDDESNFDTFINKNPQINIVAIKRYANPLYTYFYRVKIYRKLLKSQPDYIIFSGKFSIWLAGLSWHKCNTWGVIHGSEIKQSGIFKWLFERGIKRMNGIISVSSFTQDFLLSVYPNINPNKCHVINNGFELTNSLVNNRQIKSGDCNIITVGGMHRRKGQHNIISALPLLAKHFNNIHYTIAGLPESMPSLKQQAYELGVEKYVTFVPNPSNDILVELLKKNDVFAMLSENLPNGDIEGFGIAILEAMSLGLPAIGSNDSGIRDAIDHNKSGILIKDIHNPNQICDALEMIMNNYSNYSLSAKIWSERFRWSNVIDQYLKLMKSKQCG